MDLESQVLKLLQENPNRDFNDVEVYSEIYHVKPSSVDLTELCYKVLPTVEKALNSLVNKNKIERKLVGSPRLAIVYQIKRN